MNQFGPMYISTINKVAIYTVAPQGSIIVKLIGTSKWIPSAATQEEFDRMLRTGELIPWQRP